jgi:putative transposase
MKMKVETNELQYFTATILEWKQLLKPNKYKDIIVDSLTYLVEDKRIEVFGFVIMSNHIHLIWRMLGENTKTKVQQSFLKFTAQQIKFDLQKHHPAVLAQFKVDAKDSEYQIWERNPYSFELFKEKTFWQKLNYIHQNPVTAGLCKFPEEYYYSFAKFYETGETNFNFLTNYKS